MRLAPLQISLIVVFSAGLAGAWGLRHPLPPLGIRGNHVTVDTALSWGDSVLWLDARGKEDYAQAHIRNALPLTSGNDFNQQYRAVRQVHKDGQKIVVYCASASCPRADWAAEKLRDQTKWPDIYVLDGGWEAWQAYGGK